MSRFCVIAGTKITLNGGKSLPIEQIKAGEEVLSFDLNTLQRSQKYDVLVKLKTNNFSGIIKKDYVKNIWKNTADEYFAINDRLKITGDHIVLAKRDNTYYWTKVFNLKIGDYLFTEFNIFEKIETIILIKEKVKVFNLEVNSIYNYFANSYLIHNGAPCSACAACGAQGGPVTGLLLINSDTATDRFMGYSPQTFGTSYVVNTTSSDSASTHNIHSNYALQHGSGSGLTLDFPTTAFENASLRGSTSNLGSGKTVTIKGTRACCASCSGWCTAGCCPAGTSADTGFGSGAEGQGCGTDANYWSTATKRLNGNFGVGYNVSSLIDSGGDGYQVGDTIKVLFQNYPPTNSFGNVTTATGVHASVETSNSTTADIKKSFVYRSGSITLGSISDVLTRGNQISVNDGNTCDDDIANPHNEVGNNQSNNSSRGSFVRLRNRGTNNQKRVVYAYNGSLYDEHPLNYKIYGSNGVVEDTPTTWDSWTTGLNRLLVFRVTSIS